MERATNDVVGVPRARSGEPEATRSTPAHGIEADIELVAGEAPGTGAEIDALDAGAEIEAPEPAAAPAPAVEVRRDELTDREREILDFERGWWRRAGSKEQAIRDRFGLSATRYYQLLNGLLDRSAALEHDPVLVKRLRRLRATRSRTRRPS